LDHGKIVRHDDYTGIISEFKVEVPKSTTYDELKTLVQQHDKSQGYGNDNAEQLHGAGKYSKCEAKVPESKTFDECKALVQQHDKSPGCGDANIEMVRRITTKLPCMIGTDVASLSSSSIICCAAAFVAWFLGLFLLSKL
jgi:hypothetical protein